MAQNDFGRRLRGACVDADAASILPHPSEQAAGHVDLAGVVTALPGKPGECLVGAGSTGVRK
jgi:hypothetical protein